MMENAKNVFLNYTKEYEDSGRKDLKVNHILRVAGNSLYIGKELGLNEEDLTLAYLIGIFHDIGRFEQIKLYDTFSDKVSGLNHATYSNKVLFEDGLIDKFNVDSKYYDIIKIAVENHNKMEIEYDGLSDREILFAKIIRDADKLDIFYVINNDELENIFWYKDFDSEEINEELIKTFEEHKLIDYKIIKNNADQIVTFYDYIYNLYFKSSLLKLKKERYLDSFTDKIIKGFKSDKVKEQIKYLNDIANEFLNRG